METRVLILDEDTNDAADLVVDLPEPPLTHDELIEAYDEAGGVFTVAMGPWAQRHLWPLAKKYAYDDNDVSVLVTFLDSDPDGQDEMEFYMIDGVLQ